jgi:hypothetical protein
MVGISEAIPPIDDGVEEKIMLNASWYKIVSLSALQGSIVLAWVIYNIYLPKLLISCGISPRLAILLIIIENAIAFILEPLFGSLSDRAYRWIATKFGFISLGVIVTSVISMLIPTIVIFQNVLNAIDWILPGVLITWAMAMTIFRTPAISLIGRYAFASDLPIAMSFLTLVGGFVGALRPVVQDFILSLGAPVAFTIASIVLLAATALLRYFDPPMTTNLGLKDYAPVVPMKVGLLIGTGLGIAWGSRCLLETLPKIIEIHIPQLDSKLMMVFISLTIAISAIPGGLLAAKCGNRQAMLMGLITTLLALLTIVFIPTSITISIAILLIVICFSWVTNGAIPFAIGLFPAERLGLAIGFYFSGFSAGLSSFSSMFNPISNLTPLLGAMLGSIGFILAGVCILTSFNFDVRDSK